MNHRNRLITMIIFLNCDPLSWQPIYLCVWNLPKISSSALCYVLTDQVTIIEKKNTINSFMSFKKNARDDYSLTTSREMDPNGILRRFLSCQVRSSQLIL